MKKLGLIMMPLMAMSLLTSCGNNNKKPDVHVDLPIKIVCTFDWGYYEKTLQYNEHHDVTKLVTDHYVEETFEFETVKTYEYKYDKNGNILVLIEIDTQGEYSSTYTDVYTYDSLNRVIFDFSYMNVDYIKNPEEWYRKDEYFYTEGKQYKDFEERKEYYKNGGSTYTEEQTFDEKGRVIKLVNKYDGNIDTITEYEYDEYDCVIKTTENCDGDISESASTYYKNNPLKPLHVDNYYLIDQERILSNTIDYEYGVNDRIEKETQKNNDGTLFSTIEYFYE